MFSFACIQRVAAPRLAAFTLAACAAANVHAADLTVHVKGVRAPQGLALVALYSSADTFLKPGRHLVAQRVPVDGGSATVVFRDLPVGRYALTAIHDENGNGRLDINLLGSNVEPVGFSNDAFGNAAPPSFDKAALDFSSDAVITINLR